MAVIKKNSQKTAKALSYEEFEIITSFISGKPIVKQRRSLAIALLYLTGLGVCSLLCFNVKHAKDLFEKGSTLVLGKNKKFVCI